MPIPAPHPGAVPLDWDQNQMELHSVEQARTQSEQQTQDDIHQVSPLRPTEQPQTNVPLTEHYRSPCSSQTQPVVWHVTYVTMASAMFVPLLCNVAGLPHSRLQIVRNWVNSQHDGMWQTMVRRTQFVHEYMLWNGSNANTSTTTRSSSAWPTPKSDGITLCGADQDTVCIRSSTMSLTTLILCQIILKYMF